MIIVYIQYKRKYGPVCFCHFRFFYTFLFYFSKYSFQIFFYNNMSFSYNTLLFSYNKKDILNLFYRTKYYFNFKSNNFKCFYPNIHTHSNIQNGQLKLPFEIRMSKIAKTNKPMNIEHYEFVKILHLQVYLHKRISNGSLFLAFEFIIF